MRRCATPTLTSLGTVFAFLTVLFLAGAGPAQAVSLFALSDFSGSTGSNLYVIDTTDVTNPTLIGQTTVLAPFGLGDFGGRLFSFDQLGTDVVEEIDPTDASTLNTFNVGIQTVGEGGITFDSSGTGFLSQSSGVTGTLWDFNLNALTNNVIDIVLSPSMDGLDFNSSDVLYGISQSAGDLYTISTANGDTTLIGSTGITPGLLAGLTFDGQNNLFAITIDGRLFSVNAGDASSVLIGSTGLSDVSGLSALNAVPEPSTPLLLGSGLVGLVGWRSRQNRLTKAS